MGRFWWPADGAPSRVCHSSVHRLLLPILLSLPFTPPRCFFSVLLSVPLNISWSLAYQNPLIHGSFPLQSLCQHFPCLCSLHLILTERNLAGTPHPFAAKPWYVLVPNAKLHSWPNQLC